MKKTFAFILMISFFSTMLYASEIKTYDSNYKGLHVGYSNENDAKRLFGKPREVFHRPYVKYIYPNFHITFHPSKGVVNTIILYDDDYIDENGIHIGATFFDVKSLTDITCSPDQPESCADFKSGIVYWFENNEVTKIILAHKLKKRR